MGYGRLSIDSRNSDFEDPKAVPFHFMGVPIPSICRYWINVEWKDVSINLLKSPIRYALNAAGAHSLYITSLLGWTWKPNFSYP
jgi:hypothetical protein